MAPNSLVDALGNNGQLEYILGDFGHIPYGERVNGIIVIPSSGTDEDSSYGCSGITPINPNDYPGYAVFIALKRGKCTFAQKALNAQLAGSSAVLIFDDLDEDINRIHMVYDHECIFFF